MNKKWKERLGWLHVLFPWAMCVLVIVAFIQMGNFLTWLSTTSIGSVISDIFIAIAIAVPILILLWIIIATILAFSKASPSERVTLLLGLFVFGIIVYIIGVLLDFVQKS